MEYEFYFPKTKSKHMATPVKGKVYPSKGGTVRYGIQATMNGSMSLPKYIKEEEFNRLGFGAEEKKNCGCGQDPCMTYGAETYDAEIEGNVEYERMEERTVDVLQEIEQPFSVQTDPAEYEHEYPEDIENAIKHGIHKQLYDNPDSKLAREGGFIENIETDVEVVDLEDDPDGEPRELTAYGNLGKPEVNEEEEYGREAKTNFIDEEFRNEGVYEGSPYDRVLHEKGDYRIIAEEDYDALRSYEKGMEEDEYQKLKEQADTYGMFYIQVQKKVMGGWETIDSLSGVVPSDTVSLEDLALTEMEIPDGVIFEATSGSGMINHNAIDKVIERPAIMRYNHAFTDYDWESDEDLDEFEENLLKEEIVDAVGRSPNKGSKNLFIDIDNKDVYVSTNTNHGEGRFYGFNAESKMDNCPICKEEVYGDMSMISEEIIPDICGNCDIYIMPQGISCIECGFGDTYGSATPCESCEPIAEKMEMVNMDAETYDADEGYVQIGTMQSTPADGYNGYMKMMRDARSLVEIGNMTGLNQKLGEAYQDETGRWFLPILQKNAETVGNPSPSSPLEETPATVPSPAEPTNENFESQNSNMKLALGLSALGIGLAFWKGKEVMSLWDSITSRLKK